MINWDSYTKHSADWHVQRLISSSGPYAFPNIPKTDVVNGLRRRLSGAKNIDQQNTNTCGPAAFFYVFLQTKPHLYTMAVVDLYVNGMASFGQYGPLEIKPSEGAKNIKLHSGDIEAVDWILLASLRDSENQFLPMDTVSTGKFLNNISTGLAGYTLPNHLVSWFKRIGFNNVIDQTSLFSSQTAINLYQAQELRQKDYVVCMLINQVILSSTQKYSGIPQHWVVLNSDINVNGAVITSPLAQNLNRNRKKLKEQDELEETLNSDESPSDEKPVIRFGDTVSFDVYTWGDDYRSLRNGMTTAYLDELLYDYFGFVAAKW